MNTSHVRFLIADDHAMIRLAVKQTLAQLPGHPDVLEAANAAETEQHLERANVTQQPITLAILDIKMPGALNAAWFAALAMRHPSTRFALFSGIDDAAIQREYLNAGMHAFIPKSLSTEKMLAAIELILGNSGFRLFAGKIYLDKYSQFIAAFFTTDTLKPLSQFERIDGLDHIKKLYGLASLV